ncbi:MAG: arylamine N-acetyltransferase [Acidimicrobiia bacterium]
MDATAYLARIGLDPGIEPTLANLERLQRAHLTAVPFENLDVFHRRGVRTTEDWSVPKIVDRRRGGWCFELNGAFAWLLTELGYRVRRLAATVIGGSDSPMPTHLTLEVSLDRPYLVDVGFGDSFIRPLPLDSEGPHDGGTGRYGFVFEDTMTTLVSHEEDDGIKPQYRFGPDERTTAGFEPASMYLQTTPGLAWTESRFATRLIDGGPDRVTLLEDVLKFRREGVWIEERIEPDDWAEHLHLWFEMTP